MSEISFRAWDNENCEWIEDFVIRNDGLLLLLDEDANVLTSDVNAHVMRNTKLIDVKGVEIYEGDILGLNRNYVSPSIKNNSYVIFVDGGFCRTVSEKHRPVAINKEALKTYEVIGNIHENPELLSESNE